MTGCTKDSLDRFWAGEAEGLEIHRCLTGARQDLACESSKRPLLRLSGRWAEGSSIVVVDGQSVKSERLSAACWCLAAPPYEPILISRQSLYSTLAICEQKGSICPSPQCQRSGDRGVCPLPTMLNGTSGPFSQNEPSNNCKFFAGRHFAGRSPATTRKMSQVPLSSGRAPNRCDVLRGQMAKVEL